MVTKILKAGKTELGPWAWPFVFFFLSFFVLSHSADTGASKASVQNESLELVVAAGSQRAC